MKSPIKNKLLRNPGESLDKQLNDVLLDGVLFYLLTTLIVVVMAAQEWWRWYTKSPPSPVTVSLIALSVAIFSYFKVQKAWINAKNIKLGLEGEKAVGQFLDQFRENGAKIIHDVPGDGFNIDHVVVDQTGIYAIETKTLSKPDRGPAELTYDGKRILKKNGLEPDRNPVIQILAGSKWLSELIQSSTGKQFPVKPVVLYPGWFINSTQEGRRSHVWVLNPKSLPKFIEKRSKILGQEDVSLCAYHLQRYIRSA